MRDRLIAYLWPALRPLVLALIQSALDDLAAQQAQAPTRPAKAYFGTRRDA
jgi:hypothetical protein